jgi:hypothetical protein
MATKTIVVLRPAGFFKNVDPMTKEVTAAVETLDREGYRIVGITPVAGSDGATSFVIVAGQKPTADDSN